MWLQRLYSIISVYYLALQHLLSLFVIMLLVVMPSLLYAEKFNLSSLDNQNIYLDIPGQSLPEALIAFSKSCECVVISVPNILQQHKSQAVKGYFNLYDALTIILENTPLEIVNKCSGFVIVSPEKDTVIEQEKNTLSLQSHVETIEQMHVVGREYFEAPLTNYTQQSILDAQYFDLYDIDTLANISAGLSNITSPGSTTGEAGNYLEFNLRGINSSGNDFVATEPIVLHYNGQHKTPLEATNLTLFDMDSVNIFYGPQITQSGRHSSAGSMYYRTALPVLGEDSIVVGVGAGNYNWRRYTSVINKTLSETFALRFSAIHHSHDGYIDIVENYAFIDEYKPQPVFQFPLSSSFSNNEFRTSDNLENYDSNDKNAVRLSALWELDERFLWESQIEMHRKRGTGTLPLDPFVTRNYGRLTVADTPGRQWSDSLFVNSNFYYQFPNATLRYHAGWSDYSSELVRDNDLGRQGLFDEFRLNSLSKKLIQHNLELYSNNSESITQWLLGMLIEDIDHSHRSERDIYHPDFDFAQLGFVELTPKIVNKTRDIYARISHDIMPHTQLAFGLRFNGFTQKQSEKQLFLCSQPIRMPSEYSVLASYNNQDPFQDFLSNRTSIPESIPPVCNIIDQNNGTELWESTVYEFGFNHDFKNHSNFFSRFSTGVTPGYITFEGDARSQKVRSFEMGWYKSGVNNDLKFSISTFYNHIEHLQPFSEKIELSTVSENNELININYNNRANAKTYGVDITLNYSHDIVGDVSLNASYLEATIDDYIAIDFPFLGLYEFNPLVEDQFLRDQGYSNLSGNALIKSPKHALRLQHSKTFPMKRGALVSVFHLVYSDSYYLDIYNRGNFPNAKNVSRQGSYKQFDFSLIWESEQKRYKAKAFVKNLTNTLIKAGVNGDNVGPEGYSSTFSAPRTLGVSFSLQY